MAAKTPSTIRRESAGSQTKIVAYFTDIDDTDTWASKLPGVQDWAFSRIDNPTNNSAAGLTVAHSSGTFTFYCDEDNVEGYLIVYGQF
jgi:hypothetical protein